MKSRYDLKTVAGLMAFSFVMIFSQVGLADNPAPTSPTPVSKPSTELAKLVQDITDAVLEHHIDPPARQQMILSGIKAVYRTAGVPVPPDLGRRVSAIATSQQLEQFFAEIQPKLTARPIAAEELAEALFDGLLSAVPSGASLISAKERKVAEQVEGNRYVGIHIALGINEEEDQPNIREVFPGGPADRAGVKKDDLIEQINGVATKGVKLRDVVDRLRGAEGTDVKIQVRQPKEKKSRTYTITRGALPRETVTGVRRRPAGGWDLRPNPSAPIGYLRITEITASTPHELRKLERQLESEGIRAIVLDLRAQAGNSVHPAVLLADCLLERGPIGRVKTARGETSYQADPDALFRGWPMAVLVDLHTSGTAEWLAAALQDNHRATIVGAPTSGSFFRKDRSAGSPAAGDPMPLIRLGGVRSRVPVGDGSWSIDLLTGYLERGDGRPLSASLADTTDPRSGRSAAPRDKSGQPRESQPGVEPDLLTGRNPMSRGTLAQRQPSRPASQPRPNADEPLDEAIRWLQGSLKKS